MALVILVGCFFIMYNKAKTRKAELVTSYNFYLSMVEDTQEWLSNTSISNGALPLYDIKDGATTIVPYFSDVIAMSLLQGQERPKYEKVVKEYLNWHFSHINDGSKGNDITGAIFNYEAIVKNGVVISEKSKNTYDSLDSYAALFLIVLWEYYEKTGDEHFLVLNQEKIFDVIDAMILSIDIDGLSYAKPDYKVKYLMDNSEVSMGIDSATNILKKIILPKNKISSKEYKQTKLIIENLKEIKKIQEEAFNTKFWNEQDQRYETGYFENDVPNEFIGWSTFYPDAVSQLFPIVFGVIDSNSKRAKYLYSKFGENYDWEHMMHFKNDDASFYWGIIAYCAALMKDDNRVRKYLDYFRRHVAPAYVYPSNNADVAWVVMAGYEMMDYYDKRIKMIDPFGIFPDK